MDIVNGPSGDMADQKRFESLLQELQADKYVAVLALPPCSTFSRARGRGPGPRKVRGNAGPDRYGLPGLKPHEKEAVRLGTLLACRAFQVMDISHDRGIPGLLEDPAEEPYETSIFKLNEWKPIGQLAGVVTNRLAQCQYGLDHVKPKEVMAASR